MASKITVRPNQTMSNVVLQAVGSLEGAMQFCYDNSVAVSDEPVAGTVYVVSDAALAAAGAKGAAVLRYVAERGVVFGNLAPDVPLHLLAEEDTEEVFEDEEDGVLFEDEG